MAGMWRNQQDHYVLVVKASKAREVRQAYHTSTSRKIRWLHLGDTDSIYE